MSDAFDLWVLRRARGPNAETMPLLCLPYAGGGIAAFRGWELIVGPLAEPWLIRLPGRESRAVEPGLTDLRAIAGHVAAAVAPRLRGAFALAGHSMGAVLAYELAHELNERYALTPHHLTVSARSAPHLPPRHPPVADLPDERFLAALDERYGGLPAALRADREFVRFILPTLRTDVTALEAYSAVSRPPLPCPIAVVGGRSDPTVTVDELRAWRTHTTQKCDLRLVDGGHFYLNERREALPEAIADELARLAVAW
ncbi:alpha/beta fold hydrolase [Phytohabitans flavus]|uniref:Thioesterase n=1 Tax=Phytohabitans flavus TaxID=1076124 RepID=A0A6F8XM47_9ACTN|nr:alpha/beta fold hydrolase [Phytohabitans flavus]BCB74892.1 thioesterase [Phytohabitans flavus]